MEVVRTAFGADRRVVECASCGAMLEAPCEGARTACPRCGAVTDVLPRADVPMRAPLDDVAEQNRLHGLAAWRLAPPPVDLYDLDIPPPGFTADPSRDAGSADALRSAWNAARPTLWQVSPARQRDALWLALHLADLHVARAETERARALLETGLDLLSDGGLRHLIRCRLATLALWQRDASSAYHWLSGCDFAAEELPLDSALREGRAALAEVMQDHALTLSIVGETYLAVPIAVGWERTCGALRIRALAALGRNDDADAELARQLAAPHGAGMVAAVGDSHPVVLRHHRRLLAAAAAERDAIPAGAAAVFYELAKLPYFALAVLILVTLPRWFFDADAFGGAQGYLLCPQVCADCRGPFRVHTPWRHADGSHGTNGADYYCQSPSNDVGSLAESELVAQRPALRSVRLSWAPGALTYLTLLGLLVPVSVGTGVRQHYLATARRREREPAIAALAKAADVPLPPAQPVPAGPDARLAAWSVAKAAAFAVLVVVVDLFVHHLTR